MSNFFFSSNSNTNLFQCSYILKSLLVIFTVGKVGIEIDGCKIFLCVITFLLLYAMINFFSKYF